MPDRRTPPAFRRSRPSTVNSDNRGRLLMSTQTLDCTVFLAAVEAAIRAPSLHNSQPWRFRLREGALEGPAHPPRRVPAAHPRGLAMRAARGAAALNTP